MKIDFSKIEEASIPNFKGGELHTDARMFYDGQNRIMLGKLVPGASIGMHTHEDSSEVIYILEGVATQICNGEEEILAPGDCHYCPKGSTHTLINRGDVDVKFFAVVPHQ